MAGFDNYKVKAGEHVGYISCNEMLLVQTCPWMSTKTLWRNMHLRSSPMNEADKVRVQLGATFKVQRDSSPASRWVRLEGEGMGRFDQSVNLIAPPFSKG